MKIISATPEIDSGNVFPDLPDLNDALDAGFYFKIKRCADILLSLIVLIATAPVMLTLIVLIKLESKGPALYIQDRIGKDGNILKIYKLRTMYQNTEASGGGVRTIEGDPRITKIGKLIRECSLDEFPQFLNILKGEMSFIGPRPISVDEHNAVLESIKAEGKPIPQGLIHKVKPGITGWATLHGREKITYEDRFRLNSEYEDKISMAFDLKIFYLTFKKYALTFICVTVLFLSIMDMLIKKFF